MCQLRISHIHTMDSNYTRTHTRTDAVWSFLICNTWNFPFGKSECRVRSIIRSKLMFNVQYYVYVARTHHGINGASFKILKLHFTGIHTISLFRVIKFMRFNAFTNIAFQCNFHSESFVLWQGQNVAQIRTILKRAQHTHTYVQRRRERKFGSDWIKDVLYMMVFYLSWEWMNKCTIWKV